MRRKILIVTSEMLPLPGKPVCGGGIRVWGLGKGLEAAGHKVIYSLPKDLVENDETLPEEIRENGHVPEKLGERIMAVMPDLVIVEQWGLATYLSDMKIPLAIDLHGSLTLENAFKKGANFLTDAFTKIETLAKADFLICPGQFQKNYFYSWFLLSGADPLEAQILVAPIGMDPEQPKRKKRTKNSKPQIVYGGVTWPWIDPFPGLEIAAKAVAKHKDARMDLYVQAPPLMADHPLYAINKDVTKSYDERLAKYDRVNLRKFISHDKLIDIYRGATVAFDLYRANHERELAITTRTVEYLWCGLPVIYSDYNELAQVIAQYDAGWIVDPNDEEAVEAAVKEALNNPELAEEKGRNAQRLAREHFGWDKAATEILPFAINPPRREKKPTIIAGVREFFKAEKLEELRRNEELVRLSKELLIRDKKIDELGQQVGMVLFDKERALGELRAEMREAVKDKDQEIKRLLASLQEESKIRDNEIHRLNSERIEREATNQVELRKLAVKHETDLKAAEEKAQQQVQSSVDRHEQLLAKAREENAKHVERLVSKYEAMLTDLREKHDQETKDLVARYEQALSEVQKSDSEEKEGMIKRNEQSIRDAQQYAKEEVARLVDKYEGLLGETRTQANAERERASVRYEQLLREANERTASEMGKTNKTFEDSLKAAGDRHTKELAATIDKYEAMIKELNESRSGTMTETSEKYEAMLDEIRKKSDELVKQTVGDYETNLRRTRADASAELMRRDKALEKSGERLYKIDARWREQLQIKEEALVTLTEQVRKLQEKIDTKLKSLAKEAEKKEDYLEEAESKFAQLKLKLDRRAGQVESVGKELSELRAKLGDAEWEKGDLAAKLEELVTHTENLEREVADLRKRASVAERQVDQVRSRPDLRSKSRRADKKKKYLSQLPRLGYLWSMNLVAQTYMELWQRRAGRIIFPGTRKPKNNDGGNGEGGSGS
jgi:glycosyltransferase involved in cell wall biosynthesis/vacuolar-type H+-ATPase subunit H